MAAITSHDDLARLPSPVTITPAPPGKWRWVGTQTLIFDPEKRFPMATEYKVEIPAGTRAANGSTLAKAETWTFSTPPPRLVNESPSGRSVGLDPVFFAEFDQAIDQEALLGVVEVTAKGQAIPTRLATDEEIQADPNARVRRAGAPEGRWIAFKAKQKLPVAAAVVVRFPAGTPSAEGPRRTEKPQQFGFTTYSTLSLAGVRCGWGDCPPGAPWTLSFSNPLDTKRFNPDWVKISPELASMRVEASGDEITIQPRSRGKTKYRVTVAGALSDTFGQSLGKDITAEITVGPARPFLFPEEEDMVVLDPTGSAAMPIFSVNRPRLNVRLYAVTAADWPKYEAWRSAWDTEERDQTPPGRLVASRTITPEKKPDELVVTPIDLGPALKNGLGQVVVVIEPPGPPPKDRWQREWVRSWVQVTRIGVDAFIDSESMVAWTTRLADGAPEAGVTVGIVEGLPGATTGADGLARLDLPEDAAKGLRLIQARKGEDLALLPERYIGSEGYARRRPNDAVRWLALVGPSYTHAFEVQEFRRPEFEVSAYAAAGPFFVGDHTNVTVAANYYAGGGLPNAEVDWSVLREDATFVPPNRRDFTFGKAEPGWWSLFRPQNPGRTAYAALERWKGTTNASGEHRLRVDFDALTPPWYEHQNLRDERVEAFASLLWDGVYDYSYVARATTPGAFVVPPAKAEEMYSPETFGRSAGDRVIIE